jgi:polyisoprenoid-binding protein YceI
MTTHMSTDLRPGTYTIDLARSTCRLGVTHAFGLLPVAATVEIRAGTVTIAADPARSTCSAELDAASFTSDDPRRDRNVRRFLDAARHPVIAFRGDRCTRTDRGWELTGTLRVRGRDSEVTLLVDGVEPTPDGYRCTARCTLDRIAAGVSGGRGLVARTVHISLDVVAT